MLFVLVKPFLRVQLLTAFKGNKWVKTIVD